MQRFDAGVACSRGAYAWKLAGLSKRRGLSDACARQHVTMHSRPSGRSEVDSTQVAVEHACRSNSHSSHHRGYKRLSHQARATHVACTLATIQGRPSLSLHATVVSADD